LSGQRDVLIDPPRKAQHRSIAHLEKLTRSVPLPNLTIISPARSPVRLHSIVHKLHESHEPRELLRHLRLGEWRLGLKVRRPLWSSHTADKSIAETLYDQIERSLSSARPELESVLKTSKAVPPGFAHDKRQKLLHEKLKSMTQSPASRARTPTKSLVSVQRGRCAMPVSTCILHYCPHITSCNRHVRLCCHLTHLISKLYYCSGWT
jgi:hypothetical protein